MSSEELKALAYDLIRQGVENPFDYVNEDREDLITLGVIYGMIKVVDAICKKEEQDEQGRISQASERTTEAEQPILCHASTTDTDGKTDRL